MKTFEEIRAAFSQIGIPAKRGDMEIDWLVEGKFAIGRDSDGHYIAILVGPGIQAKSEIVKHSMAYGKWQSDTFGEIAGDRLVLPAAEHFHTAMSSIAFELMRKDIESRPTAAVFQDVEPLIELVIRRLILPQPVLIGLLGELIVLRWIAQAKGSGSPVEHWKGYLRSARDFEIGATSIEVKTTSRDVAQHTIDNIDQVDTKGDDEDLLLMSIGLRRSSTMSDLSVAGLTHDLLTMIEPGWVEGDPFSAAQVELLGCIKQYGPDDCMGYDHEQMQGLEPYTSGYTFSYAPRLYRITDESIRLIRRADLEGTNVLPQGITYRVLLPETVPDSIENPRTDPLEAIREILLGLE